MNSWHQSGLIGFATLFFAFAFVGCSREEAKHTTLSAAECQKWADVCDDDVVLIVRGQKFRKADLARYVDVQIKLVELNRRIKSGREADAINDSLMKAALAYPIYLYFASEYPTNRVVSSNVVARLQRTYARNFGKKNQKWADFEQDLEKAGLARDVATLIDIEAKFAYVVDTVHSNDLVVTDVELADQNAKIDAYLAKIAATNAIHYASATNAWKRLQRGEDFAKVADECTEDPDSAPGGDWGQKDASDFTDEPAHYQEAIAHLKVGQFTEVLECNTGLEIVKLEKIVPAAISDSGEDAWQMSRIFFRRAFVPERESDDELRFEMAKDKRNLFLARTTDEAMARGEIVYPFSRRIFRLQVPIQETVEKIKGEEDAKAAATNAPPVSSSKK